MKEPGGGGGGGNAWEGVCVCVSRKGGGGEGSGGLKCSKRDGEVWMQFRVSDNLERKVSHETHSLHHKESAVFEVP